MPLDPEPRLDTFEARPVTEHVPDGETGLSEEEQAAARARAEHDAHPHTQLQGILRSLSSPTAIDINARIAMLHGAIARLAQMILSHTPAPDAPPPEER